MSSRKAAYVGRQRGNDGKRELVVRILDDYFLHEIWCDVEIEQIQETVNLTNEAFECLSHAHALAVTSQDYNYLETALTGHEEIANPIQETLQSYQLWELKDYLEVGYEVLTALLAEKR